LAVALKFEKNAVFCKLSTLLINTFTYSTQSAARTLRQRMGQLYYLTLTGLIFASLKNRIVTTACRIFNLPTRWTLLTSARKAFPIGNHDQSG